MSENYLGIMTENYDLVLTLHVILHGKVEIYRDTGVSKNFVIPDYKVFLVHS